MARKDKKHPRIVYSEEGTALYVRAYFDPVTSTQVRDADEEFTAEEEEFKKRFRRDWGPRARAALIQFRLDAGLTNGQTRRLLASTVLLGAPDGVRLQESKFIATVGGVLGGILLFIGLVVFLLSIGFPPSSLSVHVVAQLVSAMIAGFGLFLILFLHDPWRIAQRARKAINEKVDRIPIPNIDGVDDGGKAGTTSLERRIAKSAEARNYNSAIRIIRALLEEIDATKPHRAANIVEAHLNGLGFSSPRSETIAKYIEEAKALQPDLPERKP